MSDVHTQDAPERMAKQRGDTPGGFIWYELMTTDPAGAKRFYDQVVSGWSIATDFVAPGIDYRMINRSDGKMAGGVLTLTDDMQRDGARPIWVGYIHTAEVDAAVEAIKADGGSVMMEPWDQPGVGRLAMVTGPEGAPFYLMDPIPPADDPNAKAAFSPSTMRNTCAGTSSTAATRRDPSTSTSATSDGAKKATWIWARWANISSFSTMASGSERS